MGRLSQRAKLYSSPLLRWKHWAPALYTSELLPVLYHVPFIAWNILYCVLQYSNCSHSFDFVK